jgi:iron complex transport system ATP-binding protein
VSDSDPRQKGKTTTLALELRCVSARYSVEGELLREIDLEIRSGELVCVLGPNGAGKTTLLRVLAGTMALSHGDAFLFGKAIASLERRAIAKEVAVVTQRHDVAFGHSVRDVVMMGRAPHQEGWMRASSEDRRVVEDAIARCDLRELEARPVDELSGGEQKRVAIARALAQKGRVLLLDEPSAGLDVKHEIALYRLLTNEARENDVACVVVMHDLNVAAQYASRVVLMKEGRIVASGSPADVMTEDRLRETFDADLRAIAIDDKMPYFMPNRDA